MDYQMCAYHAVAHVASHEHRGAASTAAVAAVVVASFHYCRWQQQRRRMRLHLVAHSGLEGGLVHDTGGRWRCNLMERRVQARLI
jgi:hypothetical protein